MCVREWWYRQHVWPGSSGLGSVAVVYTSPFPTSLCSNPGCDDGCTQQWWAPLTTIPNGRASRVLNWPDGLRFVRPEWSLNGIRSRRNIIHSSLYSNGHIIMPHLLCRIPSFEAVGIVESCIEQLHVSFVRLGSHECFAFHTVRRCIPRSVFDFPVTSGRERSQIEGIPRRQRTSATESKYFPLPASISLDWEGWTKRKDLYFTSMIRAGRKPGTVKTHGRGRCTAQLK